MAAGTLPHLFQLAEFEAQTFRFAAVEELRLEGYPGKTGIANSLGRSGQADAYPSI